MASTKLFIYNRLDECFSVNQIISGYSPELFEKIGFDETPKERSLYRCIERIGKNYQFILSRHLEFVHDERLITDTQFIDFSSSYFEGKKCELAEYGHSRDGQPNKKQITFGISTGINGIPSALTIQKGNTQDKVHFRTMLKTSEAVLDENSLLIFDTGGNTKENKKQIRSKKFHYLTLRQKKIGPYKKLIEIYNKGNKIEITIEGIRYLCVKHKTEDETSYIFFFTKIKGRTIGAKRAQVQKNP
ncbi:MAG: hypothetical protein V1859_11100 [archaeon]